MPGDLGPAVGRSPENSAPTPAIGGILVERLVLSTCAGQQAGTAPAFRPPSAPAIASACATTHGSYPQRRTAPPGRDNNARLSRSSETTVDETEGGPFVLCSPRGSRARPRKIYRDRVGHIGQDTHASAGSAGLILKNAVPQRAQAWEAAIGRQPAALLPSAPWRSPFPVACLFSVGR